MARFLSKRHKPLTMFTKPKHRRNGRGGPRVNDKKMILNTIGIPLSEQNFLFNEIGLILFGTLGNQVIKTATNITFHPFARGAAYGIFAIHSNP